MDVESAERQLDKLIVRRGRDGANAVEELWKASERRHREELQRENREAWAEYHRGLALVHHGLAAENAARADALIEEKEEKR